MIWWSSFWSVDLILDATQMQLRYRLNIDVLHMQFRCSIDWEKIFYSQGQSFHYLYGWVVGILESNARLNSKVRLKLELKFELSLSIFLSCNQLKFILQQKKCLVGKKIWVWENFGFIKISSLKKILIWKNILGRKNCYNRKKLLVWKQILGAKFFFVRNKFCVRKIFGKKIL